MGGGDEVMNRVCPIMQSSMLDRYTGEKASLPNRTVTRLRWANEQASEQFNTDMWENEVVAAAVAILGTQHVPM